MTARAMRRCHIRVNLSLPKRGGEGVDLNPQPRPQAIGRLALLAQARQRHRPVALGKLPPLIVEHQRVMRVIGRRKPEQRLQLVARHAALEGRRQKFAHPPAHRGVVVILRNIDENGDKTIELVAK